MFITIDSDGFKLQENLPQSVNSPGYDNIAAVKSARIVIQKLTLDKNFLSMTGIINYRFISYLMQI